MILPAACGPRRALVKTPLPCDRRDLAGRQPAVPLDACGEGLAVEVLHDHVAVAGRERPEVEDLENVIVTDLASCLRLALEAANRVDVPRGRRVEDLDRNASTNKEVLSFVHRTHPARSDEADEPVFAVDDVAGLKKHARPKNSVCRLERVSNAQGPHQRLVMLARLTARSRPCAHHVGRPERRSPGDASRGKRRNAERDYAMTRRALSCVARRQVAARWQEATASTGKTDNGEARPDMSRTKPTKARQSRQKNGAERIGRQSSDARKAGPIVIA